MGIEKYSSFEQARRDQWVLSPGQEYYRRIQNFYRFVFRLHPPQNPKGIFRYRNIAEKKELLMQNQQGEKGRWAG